MLGSLLMPRTERARTRHLVAGALLTAALVSPAARGAEPAASDSGVRGRVSAEPSSPLGRATVFAYELARSTVTKATTGADGKFRFDQLPAGVYKLIAFKPGYEPAVVLFSRAASEALQFVELKLAAERKDATKGKDFWTLRDQIP